MIPFSKYVSITSGVGGASQVAQRDLIGRIFSDNALIPPDAVLEFEDAASVSTYFGAASDEAARAAFYFDYISLNITSPKKLSFARYPSTLTGPSVVGGTLARSLVYLQSVIAGTMSVQFDDDTPVAVTAIDLSTAVSLAQVATLMTAEFAASADPNVAAITVTYDATRARFTAACSLTNKPRMTFLSSGSGVTNAADALSFYTSLGAVNISGSAALSPLEAVQASVEISNNFGSLLFNETLTIEEHAEIAEYVSGLNVQFQYMVPVALADYVSWAAALVGYAGTGLTISETAGEYPEMVPMIQLAATDYTRRNSTVNYMFKQFALTPSVSSASVSDALDAARVNYYGVTQTAGRLIAFYQRGVLMGSLATAPVDMNVYANEQWLKDRVGSDIMNLLLSSGRVPANESGRAQILSVVQSAIDDAIFNGTISVGKTLTNAQRLFVTNQTGDELAWHQVQNLGYVVDAVILPYTAESGATEYKCVYSLVYSKDDAIRLVEGTHSLV